LIFPTKKAYKNLKTNRLERQGAKKIVIKRDNLYNQLWSTQMTTLAKEYGLSDVGLAKIFKKLNVPRPESRYWAKVVAGKTSEMKKLVICMECFLVQSFEFTFQKIIIPIHLNNCLRSSKTV
jgi:hypothetical protein